MVATALRAIHAFDSGTKLKPNGTANLSIAASSPAIVRFYVEDHLQVKFVQCIPVGPGRGQTWKKMNLKK